MTLNEKKKDRVADRIRCQSSCLERNRAGEGYLQREREGQESSREAVKRFREAAAEFTKDGTRSKESAMEVVVKSGTCTKSGRLTKNYRS